VPAQRTDGILERGTTRIRGTAPDLDSSRLAAEALQRACLAWETEGGSLGPCPSRDPQELPVSVGAGDGAKQQWISA
jgi:hypothetical protein